MIAPAESSQAYDRHTPEQRDQFVLGQLQEVQFIARRIHERLPLSVPFEDLVHAGVLGLMTAVRKYDPSKNVQFKSYAQFRIRGAIIDSLRTLDRASRRTRSGGRKLDEANTRLSLTLGREPSEEEIAQELGVSLTALRKLTRTLDSLEAVGSHVPQGVDRAETNDLIESAPAAPENGPLARYVTGELQHHLALALGDLSPREQQVISLYYVEQLTMHEIAVRMRVGEARVSQIHCAALEKMRAYLEDKEIKGLRSFVIGS